jgi:D-alanyl-D-alanine carboxypeptidase
MKKTWWVVLLIAVVGVSTWVGYNNYLNSRPLDRETEQKLDQLMTASLKIYHSPGMMLGIWVPGRGSFVKAVGLADTGTGRKMSLADSYRIGSLTKTFTATVILQLAEEGKLSLDDTLYKFIPSVPNGRNITVRQLLNMTSGLHSYSELEWVQKILLTEPLRSWTPEKLVRAGVAIQPDFAPGKGFHYSNTNYILLGMIIEKVTGQSLAETYKSRIIDRLGLARTYYPKDAKLRGEYCRGYMSDEGKWLDWTEQDPSWAWAAGGLISDLADMKRYAKALSDGSLLGVKFQRERATTWVEMSSHTAPGGMSTIRYGLGEFTAGGFVGHNGALPGYVNLAVYNPANGATILFMLNVQPAQGDAMLQTLKAVFQILYPGVKI